jgi:sulfate/thiosulfate-binding protein
VIDPLVVAFGLGVGILVGLTGIGGGSLMTPLLVLVVGVQPVVAIGTDLAYGAITKTVGGWRHLRSGAVDLGVSKWLAVGSVPGAIRGVLAGAPPAAGATPRPPGSAPLAVLVVVALVVAGCGGADDTVGGGGAAVASGKGSARLSLVAYSTPQVVYDEVIRGFERTAAGRGVSFAQSYGASGDQSRAVEGGLVADVVTFSLEPDMTRLVRDGLVARDWAANAHGGLVSRSVVALIVRSGNPKNIRSWDDLLRPGVRVLTPNPFTSGAAKWNILAAYGAKSGGGEDPRAGLAYLRELLTRHVTTQDKSGREALQDFASGNGDVLISYENEAITAQRKGLSVDYVIPDRTILIENPIAVVARSRHPEQARAFVDYVLSPAAQQKFADWGYRPVDEAVFRRNESTFPTPGGLFTIRDLGGWGKVNDEFFDPDEGSVARIEADAGVSIAK